MQRSLTKWDKRFMDLAHNIAQWSRDPKRKVGCVIAHPNRRQLATGYNGFPVGIADTDARLGETEVKNSITVHAELNAILNCRIDVSGWSVYVTFAPCIDCCKAMIQAGIHSVICPNLEDNSSWCESQRFGMNLLHESGINVIHYDEIAQTRYDYQGLENNTTGDTK